MAIGVRPDVYGNEATATFTRVEDAVAHLKAQPTFEVVPDENICPYGDVEGNVPAGVSEDEFNRRQETMIRVLSSIFQGHKYAITTASSYEMKRWSSHWHVADTYVATKRHAKHFADELYARIELPEGIKGDLAVYNTNQKFRNGNTPTAKGQVRPFKLVHGSWEDTFISWIEDAELLEFNVPVEMPRMGEVTKVEDSELVGMLDCISTESWSDYSTCRNLVWAMCSCSASSELIHQYCQKATNYGMTWVNNLIRDHRPDRSPSLSFLRKYARLGNPQAYLSLVFSDKLDPAPYIEEMMRLTEDEKTTMDTGRYLMELPVVDTMAVKCPMGCGKTVEIKRQIEVAFKQNKDVRILVLSGRRTWSDHIYGELKHLDFVHYEKYKAEQFEAKKGKVTTIDAKRLIIQMSPASMKLIEGQVYDLVVGDECETILSMMSPLSIYKNITDFMAMGLTFEKLMRETKRVIFMDAFLCDRTMDMLRELRSNVYLVVNTTQPYDKQCIQYTSKDQFYMALASKIRFQNKRVVSVWGTVKAGTEFQTKIPSVKSVFYHAKSDAKIKARDMEDVNAWWSTYQSVGYTGTITVGINYTNTPPFDLLSLYATCWGGTARDFAQALGRSRSIKENTVLAYIDPSTKPISVEPGMDAQEKLWVAERSLRRSIIEKLNENADDWTTIPDWWKRVIMRNRNEIVINSRFFEVLMPTYMHLCGIKFNLINQAPEKKKAVAGGSLISIETVRDIDDTEAEWLHNNRRGL
jgi:3-keto-L-gulonate-6-phosphate decarboxylase